MIANMAKIRKDSGPVWIHRYTDQSPLYLRLVTMQVSVTVPRRDEGMCEWIHDQARNSFLDQ